jgi:hypothetical protein
VSKQALHVYLTSFKSFVLIVLDTTKRISEWCHSIKTILILNTARHLVGAINCSNYNLERVIYTNDVSASIAPCCDNVFTCIASPKMGISLPVIQQENKAVLHQVALYALVEWHASFTTTHLSMLQHPYTSLPNKRTKIDHAMPFECILCTENRRDTVSSSMVVRPDACIKEKNSKSPINRAINRFCYQMPILNTVFNTALLVDVMCCLILIILMHRWHPLVGFYMKCGERCLCCCCCSAIAGERMDNQRVQHLLLFIFFPPCSLHPVKIMSI